MAAYAPTDAFFRLPSFWRRIHLHNHQATIHPLLLRSLLSTDLILSHPATRSHYYSLPQSIPALLSTP